MRVQKNYSIITLHLTGLFLCGMMQAYLVIALGMKLGIVIHFSKFPSINNLLNFPMGSVLKV